MGSEKQNQYVVMEGSLITWGIGSSLMEWFKFQTT